MRVLRAMATLAAVALTAALAACGDDELGQATTGGGPPGALCDGGTCGDGGDGPPTCRGAPMPEGEVALEADGLSFTLPCPASALRVTVVEDAIVRLRYRSPDAPPERASYAIALAEHPAPTALFGASDDAIVACTAQLSVRVARSDCRVEITGANGAVLSADPEGGGYFDHDGESGVVREAPAGERYYGFGERTGPLDKRGRAMTFWNTDAYVAAFGGYPPDADPLYQSIPFFIGLRGEDAYGVFVDDTGRMTFDMAREDAGAYRLAGRARGLDQYLVAGPTIAEVIERFTRLTGRAPLPPRWALGFHQSRWGYYPDAAVLGVAQELRARAIPADGMFLDIQHMDAFRSWTWDPVGFPDPAGLVASLDAIGIKTTAIVDPAIKVDPAWDVYAGGVAAGHFLMDGASPYVGEVWPGASVFPDFSDPAARAWWGALVPRTLGAGVRGLWIDMNEPSNFVDGGTVPDAIAAHGDGVPGTMAELHNVYALSEARATYDGMRAAAPDRRPFLLTRAGYAGIQRYAAAWTGDAPSTWATLGTTLPMLLGMGLSGEPLVGSDVGGYSGFASPELYARWMQLGSISPFFRAHVATGTNDQEPWQFGTEVEDISRAAITERYRLLPYLYSLADEASRTGAPILRPLAHAFQSDAASHAISDEAMLGPFLLYAPVLEEGAEARSVYLPEGRWFEQVSGAIIVGPQTIDVGVTLGALPSYVREGAIVPRSQPMQWSDEAPIDPLYLDLYPAPHDTTFTLYEDTGDGFAYAAGAYARVTYTLRGTEGGASLEVAAREGSFVPPARRVVVRVRRVDHGVQAVRLDGAALPALASYDALVAAGLGWFYDDRDRSLVIVMADEPGVSLAMDYDPAIDELAPPVLMPFRVRVPAGTPTTTAIHIATSSSGWTHQALAWGPGADEASGLVPVPRGAWLDYKYTRGDWATVEKWPGCVEADDRYEQGRAFPEKVDTVWAWADACP